MHRLWLAAVLITTACGGSSRGPAWPKPTVAETDGGESLAPRKSIAVADDSSEEIELPAVKDKSDDKPVVKDTVKPETPKGATPAATPSADDPITTEEIVIEIDD